MKPNDVEINCMVLLILNLNPRTQLIKFKSNYLHQLIYIHMLIAKFYISYSMILANHNYVRIVILANSNLDIYYF